MDLFASLRPLRVLLLLGLAIWTGSPGARADDYSDLEKSVIAEALEAKEWTVELNPEGQLIEEVAVYVMDVFDHRDPVPNFVNIFHASSRDWVIEQEVLLKAGDVWETGRVLETERNLRRLNQLSLVNVVAVQGSRAGTVRLLVIVKDVWSLRLNSDFGGGGDGLDQFLINPSEENFGGIHLSAGLIYQLERDRQSFGLRVTYPRLATSRYWMSTEASFATNRSNGELEGSSGNFLFQLPLYSRHRHFAYGAELAWNVSIKRRYREDQFRMYTYTSPTGEVEHIPQTYHAEELAADYWLLNSFGVLRKHDLTYGLELMHRRYAPEDLSAYSAGAQRAFERDVVPVSDTRLSPYVQLRSYKTDFHRVVNLETLALQEDFRLGYDVLLRLYVAGQALGSSRDLVGTLAGLGITWPLGDGLVRVQGLNDIVVANDGRNEGLINLRARVAFPSLPFGRLHYDTLVLSRYQNYLNVGPFALGSNNRLRGFGFNDILGTNVMALNTEFRTTGIDILSAQVGLAAFLDIADAAPSFDQLAFHVGTGVGIRVLFPQAQRTVFRFDWGLPVSRAQNVWPGAYYFTFGQAFSMPSLTIPRVISELSPF